MVFTVNFITLAILFLHKHAASNPIIITRTQNSLRIRRPKSENPIQCTLFSTHSMPLPGMPELKPNFRCVTDDGIAITIINVPENFFKLEKFQSGKTQISVRASGRGKRISDFDSDVVSRHGVIDMTAGSGMIVTDVRSSRTKSSFAQNNDFSLAVIRVSDEDNHSPDDDLNRISNNIFGTGGAPLNLVVGYQACSGKKVNISPATGAEFSGGVMELKLTQNISGWLWFDVEDYVTDELSELSFNPSAYTNVMYILPKEVNFKNVAAYAYLNGHLSVFSNRYASKLYVLMHEIGHNFGHHHSGVEGVSVYGDNTGIMGTQVRRDDMPRACFNAAKSWWFSWYSDRHTEVTPASGSAVLNMLSIDDYLNGQATLDDQKTIARIVGNNEDDLFVMYNRAEGINSQVAGHRDQVTIVRQNGHGSQSWLEAGLGFETDVPYQWTKSNWGGGGSNLVIQICEKVAGTPDYARVIVYLQGVNDLSCNQSTCEAGKVNFKAGVLTDNWGYQTVWWLKERNAEGFFDNITLKDRQLPSNVYSEKEKCIDSSKCYMFKIRDTGKDGICCGESGNGWYRINIDDEIIKYSTFEGSRYEVTTFGACD